MKTHCTKGHELTPENLVKKNLPLRRCLTCSLDWIEAKQYGYDRDDDWLYLDYDE